MYVECCQLSVGCTGLFDEDEDADDVDENGASGGQ